MELFDDELEPNVKKMLAKRDIKGLSKVLQDESNGNDSIWVSAYNALLAISKEHPLSNSDISDIVRAIAEYGIYSIDKVFHIPHEGKEYYKEEVRKITQNILTNCETFRVGRLPAPLWSEVLPLIEEIIFKDNG